MVLIILHNKQKKAKKAVQTPNFQKSAGTGVNTKNMQQYHRTICQYTFHHNRSISTDQNVLEQSEL